MTDYQEMAKRFISTYERDRIQGFSYPRRFVIRDVYLPVDEQVIWECEYKDENRQLFLDQCEIERVKIGLMAALGEKSK